MRVPPVHRRWLAQILLLLLLLLPSPGLSSLFDDGITFPALAASVLLRDMALLGLVAYFVWSDGESPASIGWRRAGSAYEAFLGVLWFVPALLGLGLLQALLDALGVPPPIPPPAALIPDGTAEYGLALVLLVVVAVTEETLFRGFLITRLMALSGSRFAAVAISTALFALGHGYQGGTGMLAAASLGLLYALIFLWRGSLAAPTVMHLLQNLAGMFFNGEAQS